jgi:hypothetical protein
MYSYHQLRQDALTSPHGAHQLALYYDMSDNDAILFRNALMNRMSHRDAIQSVLDNGNEFRFFSFDDISQLDYHYSEDALLILTRQMRAGDGVAAYALALRRGMSDEQAVVFSDSIRMGSTPQQALANARPIEAHSHDYQAAARNLEEHNRNVVNITRERKEAELAMTSTQRVVSNYVQDNVGSCSICLTSYLDLDFSVEDQQIVFTPCKNQCSMCTDCYKEHMEEGKLLTQSGFGGDPTYKCVTCNTTETVVPGTLPVRNRCLENAIVFAKAASVSANQDHVREILYRELTSELDETIQAQSSNADADRGTVDDLRAELDHEYSVSDDLHMHIRELQVQIQSEQAAAIEERARVEELQKQLQAANDLNRSNEIRLMELNDKCTRAEDQVANLTQVVDNVHSAMGLASSSSSAPAPAAAASAPAPAPAPAPEPASSSRSTSGKRRRNPEPVDNDMNTKDFQLLSDDDDYLHPSKAWLDTDPNSWTMQQLISQAHSEWNCIKRMGLNNLAMHRYELAGGVDMSEWHKRDQEFDTKEKLRRDILVAFASGCANNDFNRRKIRLQQMEKDERRKAKGTSSSSSSSSAAAAAAPPPNNKKKKQKQQRSSSSSTSKGGRSSSPEVIVVSDSDQDPEVAEESAELERIHSRLLFSSSSRAR